MKTHFIAALAAAFALTSSPSFAQTMETTPVPKPAKPNFAPLTFLLGTWSCSSKSARRPVPYYFTTTNTMDSSGYWMIGKTTTKPTPWYPWATTGTDWTTYDADAKRWIDTAVGDYGYYDLSASPGMKGNTMVWHDISFAPGKDVTAASDLTVTKVSPTKTTSVSTFKTSKGRTVGVTTVCTKSG